MVARPPVRAAKSYGAPEVSVSVNDGRGYGASGRTPRSPDGSGADSAATFSEPPPQAVSRTARASRTANPRGRRAAGPARPARAPAAVTHSIVATAGAD